MTTASTPPSRSIAVTSRNGRTSYFAANASARVKSASHAATNAASGSERSAAAWIVPTFPHPTIPTRTGFKSRLREILRDLPPQEGERLGHLVHAVHPVLDAHPPAIVMGG